MKYHHLILETTLQFDFSPKGLCLMVKDDANLKHKVYIVLL